MRLSLFAVHLSDGVLSTPWLAIGFAGLTALMAFSVWKLREDEIPRLGVLTAAFFVSSSIHFPLLIIPVSVHLILNGLVGVVLGMRAPLVIAVGLTMQYFLLSHGGLTTIGINGCIIALPALTAGLLYPILRRTGINAYVRGVLLGGGAVAAAALLNFLVLFFGGKEDWSVLAKVVLLAHIPVAILESLVLGVLMRYLEAVKPELLGSFQGESISRGYDSSEH